MASPGAHGWNTGVGDESIEGESLLWIEVTNWETDEDCNAPPRYILMNPDSTSGIVSTSDDGDYFFYSAEFPQEYIVIDGSWLDEENNATFAEVVGQGRTPITIGLPGIAEAFFDESDFPAPEGTSSFADNLQAGEQETEEDRPPTCEEREGTSFGFFTCWLLNITTGIINFVDRILTTFLITPEAYIDAQATRDAWVAFRNIAYLLLVPALLLMVLGTALGFEFVSAYTVKKALPRMVAATVFIALSFDIVMFLVAVTNEFGNGIQGLLAGAGGFDAGFTLQDMFRPGGAADASVAVLGVAAGATIAFAPWVFSGALYLMIGFLGSAAIAIITVIFLLAFRQVAVVMLAILAPLAILAWIFPGNTRLWTLWRSFFLKLLLLYPVIMLAIGAGKLFAGVLAEIGADISADPDSDVALVQSVSNRILILIAYVGPYFVIPKMFRFAGGAFANLAGSVRDKESGLMNRSKNWGKSRREEKTGGRKEQKKQSRALKYQAKDFNRISADPDKIKGDGLGAKAKRANARYQRQRRRGIDDQVLYAAEEQYKKQELAAETFGLQKATSEMSRKQTLAKLEEVAKDESASHYQRKAAIMMLAQQQATEHLDRVRAAGFENEDIALSYNDSLADPQTYSMIKGASVANAKEVRYGKFGTGDALVKRMTNERLEQFRNASDADLAKMKAGAWKQFYEDRPDEMTERLTKILNDPITRSQIPAETLNDPDIGPLLEKALDRAASQAGATAGQQTPQTGGGGNQPTQTPQQQSQGAVYGNHDPNDPRNNPQNKP